MQKNKNSFLRKLENTGSILTLVFLCVTIGCNIKMGTFYFPYEDLATQNFTRTVASMWPCAGLVLIFFYMLRQNRKESERLKMLIEKAGPEIRTKMLLHQRKARSYFILTLWCTGLGIVTVLSWHLLENNIFPNPDDLAMLTAGSFTLMGLFILCSFYHRSHLSWECDEVEKSLKI